MPNAHVEIFTHACCSQKIKQDSEIITKGGEKGLKFGSVFNTVLQIA